MTIEYNFRRVGWAVEERAKAKGPTKSENWRKLNSLCKIYRIKTYSKWSDPKDFIKLELKKALLMIERAEILNILYNELEEFDENDNDEFCIEYTIIELEEEIDGLYAFKDSNFKKNIKEYLAKFIENSK